jgi:hypothetical protein
LILCEQPIEKGVTISLETPQAMNKAIEELDGGLKAQLASLADEIRSSEETLIRTKEGYLKVQGAIEILGILKQKLATEENNQLVDAITDPLAE